MVRLRYVWALAFALISSGPLQAQSSMADPSIGEQQAAMKRLAFLHGDWRGTASTQTPAGRAELIQTERIGPMADGTVLMIEGRGYTADGQGAFNALAVVSFDPVTDRYWMSSWSGGRSGKFPFALTSDGFAWETPAGPKARIRYRATVKNGEWHEIGTYEVEGQPPRPFVDMRVKRIGNSGWPASSAVPVR